MPKNIIGGRIVTDEIARVQDEEVERLAQHRLSTGDIVYGRRGDIGRRALISHREQGWLCGTGCLRISLEQNSALHPLILYLYLGLHDVISRIAGQAIGATLPNLNTSILRGLEVVCAPQHLQRQAILPLAAWDEQVRILTEKNSNLRRTRDLLLPKLIAGEVDVEGLDIHLGESEKWVK
jgi:type I restriction enzyme S subunit